MRLNRQGATARGRILKVIAGGAFVAGIVALIACQVANAPATDAPPSSPPAPEPLPAETPVNSPGAAEPAGSGVMPDLEEAPRTDGGGSLRADGAACSVASQCASGICEGEGCGAEQGRCAAKVAPCTRDLVTYCGCDGRTFQASGSCPRQRYVRRGACGESGTK
jgi:hypothetical protein